MQLTTTEEDIMNEKTTDLTPDTPVNTYRDSDEYKFTTQFYIAEGAAGLLSHVADKATFDEVSIRALASATFSIETAVGEMNEIFHNLLDHNLALHNKNKENILATKAININEDDDEDTSPNIKKHGPECEFNHQHLIAEGAAGLLFSASSSPRGSMGNSVINSAAYSIESAIREMNKCFQEQLNIDRSASQENILNDITTVFMDKYPQLKQARIDAIANDTTLEDFIIEFSRQIQNTQNVISD